MKTQRLCVISAFVVGVLCTASIPVFSQVQPAQNRVPQHVAINGQAVSAVSVIAAGGAVQRYSCLNPQPYATLDGTSQGWACYEASTGVWLLNALPPAQAQAPQPQQEPIPQPQVVQPAIQQPAIQQPTVIYSQPAPTVVYQQPPPVIYQQPAVIYQQPAVVYQPAQTVVYPQPATVIYQQPPTVIYTTPVHPVVVAPVYPSSVILGTAAINAAGRIASAGIIAHGHERVRYVQQYRVYDRGWRR